ncbi:AAA family ATPase [Candidatus Dependentiae bacterium]|nr:AAA family ATPase [Candidatus Dependentiae bacterium]
MKKYIAIVLAGIVGNSSAFYFSLNPFEQIRLAEKNRQAVVDGLSSLVTRKRKPTGSTEESEQQVQPSNGDFTTLAGTMPPEIIELKNYLTKPDYYKDSGITPPKGFLLHGPTGTGKTSIVRALAQETGCQLLYASASDWNIIYVGSGAKAIKELFEKARYAAQLSKDPVVVFIDEIDAIGKRDDRRADPQTITALLNEMDGFLQTERIVVIAATNDAAALDPALKRPGRFDRIIEIGLPDLTARKDIMHFYLASAKISAEVDLDELAAMTINFAPADLRNLVERAKEKAFHDGKRLITQADLIEATKAAAHGIAVRHNAQPKLKKIEKQGSHGFTELAGPIDPEVLDLKEYLTNPERFKKLGITPPKGILFVGPPGTGKTSIARALANETGCDFINKSASEFIELYVGMGAKRVRELFEEARKRANNNDAKKTIIFLDDFDTIGSRAGTMHDGGEKQQTITELLNQMDGFDVDSNIIVIAATNHPEMIDDALLRPGRFDVVIEIALPDAAKREAILRLAAKDRPLTPDVDIAELAALTAGASPAELKNMINQAAKKALHEHVDRITRQHCLAAIKEMNNARVIKRRRYIGSGG